MRKYFTKYLPVEGEIFQNNQFLFKGNLYKAGQIDQDRIEDFNHDKTFPLSQCKKVKLFLCTSEIKVGDEVMDFYFNKGIFTEEEERPEWIIVTYNGITTSEDRKNTFKVVGEVSTDAVWVTDRMEFNEHEVRLMNDLSHSLGNPPKAITYYRILCPTCKTFH